MDDVGPRASSGNHGSGIGQPNQFRKIQRGNAGIWYWRRLSDLLKVKSWMKKPEQISSNIADHHYEAADKTLSRQRRNRSRKKAGEYGAGFTVVARNSPPGEMISGATLEIEQMVNAILGVWA